MFCASRISTDRAVMSMLPLGATTSLATWRYALPAWMAILPSALPTVDAAAVLRVSVFSRLWLWAPKLMLAPPELNRPLVCSFLKWLALVTSCAASIAMFRSATRPTSWVPTTFDPLSLRSAPDWRSTVLAEIVLPRACVSESVSRVVTVLEENAPLLPFTWCASSTVRVDSPAVKLMLRSAVAVAPPCSLLTLAALAFRSLPAASRISPLA